MLRGSWEGGCTFLVRLPPPERLITAPGENRVEAVRHGAVFARCASAIAVGVGFTVLLGWVFDTDGLKRLQTGFATMKGNTAVAVILSGIALWLLSRQGWCRRGTARTR